jgi:hypothetical protein
MRSPKIAKRGKWFHSWKDGEIEWQGCVLCENADTATVQLFSWLDGHPTDQKVIPVSSMRDWSFYRTPRAMRRRYSEYIGRSKADFAWSERARRALQ